MKTHARPDFKTCTANWIMPPGRGEIISSQPAQNFAKKYLKYY
jgi:hypothetical protein